MPAAGTRALPVTQRMKACYSYTCSGMYHKLESKILMFTNTELESNCGSKNKKQAYKKTTAIVN